MSNRRRAAGLIAAATVTVAMGTGVAHADSANPQMTGSVTQGVPHSIAAHGIGSDATGEFTLAGFFHADVTCLVVSGNDAIATAVIDKSKDPNNPVGEVIVIEGVDNGNPSNGVSPDLFRVSFTVNGGVIGTGPCALPVFPPVPVESGNIVVMPG